jgi:hypothetical protein
VETVLSGLANFNTGNYTLNFWITKMFVVKDKRKTLF